MPEDLNKLKELAELFSPYATLYAVGGFVRDRLLDCECGDLDICSKLRVEEVKSILLNTDFVVLEKNLRMGTVYILSGDFKAEYTAFRTDSYDKSRGAHSPEEVRFTDSISEDALRRDFRCNAIYLDILSDKYVDPIGGIKDVKNKVLTAADKPETVFEADGLRVLRLIRFASELGFDIEDETERVARQNAWRVKDIATERIRDEIDRIFKADTAHPSLSLKSAHLRGFRLLDSFGLVDMLLPELASLKGLEQKKKYHLYDAYEHSIKAFEISPPHLRWAALLHDIGKRTAYHNNNGENMHGHDEIGAEMTNDLLSRLRFSNADRVRTVKLVRRHMVDLKGDTSFNKLRRFAVENNEIIEDICALKDIDAEASCGRKHLSNRVRDAWKEIQNDGTPLSVRDLKIDGNDLKNIGVMDRDIGRVLNELFEDTVLNLSLNDRERAMEYAMRKYNRINKCIENKISD